MFCERRGVLYPAERAVYDSLCVHTFVLTGEGKSTAKCERFTATTYGGMVYLYLLRDSTRTMPQSGDTVVALTSIRHPEHLGKFDYRKYLLRQGIIGTAFAARYDVLPAAEHSISLQKYLYQRLSSAGLDSDELATVGALTLGYKEDLDKELRNRFQAAGAAHVLAVSGLHTGILYALLMWLLTFGGRIRPKYENWGGRMIVSTIIIAVMWIYAWLTGMTPSVVRAVVMVTIFEVGRMFYRQAISLNTIAAAALLILLVRPLDLWSVSFQLSFAATASIVIIANEFEKRIHRLSMHGLRGRIGAWLAATVIISIAAQLGTLPLTMYYFGQISTYFLLTNIIVLPIATLLVPCGFISLALGGSMVGIWFSKITCSLSWLMNHSVGWIESLPRSTVHVSVSLGMICIYYVLFVLLYAVLCDFHLRN